ncbi:hypothetical protein Fmac_006014 [Flemingia macrophylla]|uniref:Uncharacterized protein n=1 Tax=Flemingia macrophylla TaxID=520843 RepID=A0ABD1N9I7_9FABA
MPGSMQVPCMEHVSVSLESTSLWSVKTQANYIGHMQLLRGEHGQLLGSVGAVASLDSVEAKEDRWRVVVAKLSKSGRGLANQLLLARAEVDGLKKTAEEMEARIIELT